MRKHDKILKSGHKEFIDQSLANGKSCRVISGALLGKGFSISHTAIRNYSNDIWLRRGLGDTSLRGQDLNKAVIEATIKVLEKRLESMNDVDKNKPYLVILGG